MRPAPAILLAAVVLAAPQPSHAALDAAWRALPASVPADSLAALLRVMEVRGARGVRPGEAAYALGQFRYARGEYGAAEEAFMRAYARLDGPDRPAARYGQALAALAAGNPGAAREAFERVAAESHALRALATWGIACCWQAQGRPEKEFDVLAALLSGDAGEATAPALERYRALAERFGHVSEARAARSRLLRDFPRAIEAARAGAESPERAAPGVAGSRASGGRSR